MKKVFGLIVALVFITACEPKTEMVQITKGDAGLNGKDGVSCSVTPETSVESERVLGARVSCTDGSYVVILNGTQGPAGVQGQIGLTGVQGPIGQTGTAAEACQAYRVPFLGAFLKCPGQWPVLIADGRDGEDGKDGASCASERQETKKRVKITCSRGHETVVSTSYVYDGDTGPVGATGLAGKSCTATPVTGGVNVKCGNDNPVFLANGAKGETGSTGATGVSGQDGEDAFTPGLECAVYDSKSVDQSNGLYKILANATPKFTKVINQLDIGDSPSANGFPKFTSGEQVLVGLEDYALDCNGYLNVPMTGTYTFHLFSDDGSRLAIEGVELINNDGLHAPAEKSTSALLLYKGPNKINVLYFQGPHTQIALDLDWTKAVTGSVREQLPAANLTH